jgi:putative intracellular protease/amidase
MRVTAITTLLGLSPFVLAVPEKPTGVNVTGKPLHYGILVFPGFQPLDVYGPLDVIGAISMSVNQSIHLSVLSRTMEPVSSKMQPSPNMTHAHSDFGHSIMPTNTFKNALENPICPETGDIEVLLVPGGGGTRGNMSEEIAFVKEMFPRVMVSPSPTCRFVANKNA